MHWVIPRTHVVVIWYKQAKMLVPKSPQLCATLLLFFIPSGAAGVLFLATPLRSEDHLTAWKLYIVLACVFVELVSGYPDPLVHSICWVGGDGSN